MRYKISVIMPALNEEQNISKAVVNVIKSFDRLDVHGEIVVVNDGSTDQTKEIVEELIEKYIQWLINDKKISQSFQKNEIASISKFVFLVFEKKLNLKHLYPKRIEHICRNI